MVLRCSILLGLAFIATVIAPCIVSAHVGRRLEVKTETIGSQEKLYALGYSSGGVDDGGGLIRPYRNAIHDHWSNVFGSATAGLPGVDVLEPGSLVGHALYAELIGVSKWVDPPVVSMGGMMMVPEGTIPILEPLSGENLFVAYNSQLVTSSGLGTLTLDNSISAAGEHLDLVYGIDLEPESVLYAIEWVFSTDAPGVTDSDSIYTILAPDGSNMAEKMHAESLFLEAYLGTTEASGAVPEPSAIVLGAFAILTLGFMRRRASTDGATRFGMNRVKRKA